MSDNTEDTYVASDQRFKQLQAILFLLQTHVEGFKEEVDRSYELLKVGAKTDFTKHIENTINDPLGNFFKISSNIDEQVKSIIGTFVKTFFVANKNIIASVYRSKTSSNDLYYSIILKEDNINTRNKIFDFFDKFDLLDISTKYPVYFQFVPIELADKINFVEEIKFD